MKIYPNDLCPCGSGKKYKKIKALFVIFFRIGIWIGAKHVWGCQ